MYQEFSVLEINPILANKQILITTNKDLNVNNTDTVIEVYERKTKTALLFDPVINGKELAINLKDWPIPNTDYILTVKNLKSVIDETLPSNIKRTIKFDSSIVSKVSIISPSMFEKINDVFIELKEYAEKEEDLKNSFYIEISTDNAFYNIVSKGTYNKNIIRIALNKNKQYFIRARVQSIGEENIQYGVWSEIITFIYGDEKESGDIDDIEEPKDPDEDYDNDDIDDSPEVDLTLFERIGVIKQGITPSQLILEFSKDIDALSTDRITIIKKVVK